MKQSQPKPGPVTIRRDGVVFSCWPRLLTVEMASLYLGLSPKTIRNHSNSLPGRKKWGQKIVFDRYALDSMIDRSRGLRSLWVDVERSG